MKKLERAPNVRGYTSQGMLNIINNPALEELLHKINDSYYYWDKVRYQPLPAGILPVDLWALEKSRRNLSAFRIRFGEHSFMWNSNNRIQDNLHFFDMNIGGTLGARGIITPEDRQRYLISSIMEEAIASSQIEGAVTTRRIAKEMLRKNRKPTNKSEQMILNNYITIQRILEIKEEPLNLERFLNIHQLVTAGTMSQSKEEGNLRADNDINVIDTANGAVVHRPPSFTELPHLLDDLFRFFNDADTKIFIHPIIKASIIHFMVGYIHPFTDGNGRTARALFYWYLLRRGYWLTEHLSISRLILKAQGQYARAFQYTEIDDHDLTHFILFNLRVMKDAFEELRLYLHRQQSSKQRAAQFLKLKDITQRQATILEWFFQDADLLLTIREAQNRLGVSHQSARLALAALVTAGYLDETPLDGKTKAFQKSRAYDDKITSPK